MAELCEMDPILIYRVEVIETKATGRRPKVTLALFRDVEVAKGAVASEYLADKIEWKYDQENGEYVGESSWHGTHYSFKIVPDYLY